MAPSTTTSLAPGRSPSRLRSKTSDLSDLLHGRKANGNLTDTEIPPVPEVPSEKPKRKLAGFLARRRKSGIIVGVADSHKESEDAADEQYPAVPEALLRRCVVYFVNVLFNVFVSSQTYLPSGIREISLHSSFSHSLVQQHIYHTLVIDFGFNVLFFLS